MGGNHATTILKAPVTAPPDDENALRIQLEKALSTPFVDGNRIDILRNGDAIFPAMLESIRGARKQIQLLTYVYWRGEIALQFATALAQKAAEGTQVKVLLDAVGAQSMDEQLITRMRESGVDVRWFRPIRLKLWKNDNRTHRKILVCDGHVAYTGGVGIADEWQGDARNPGEWRDDHFRVRGPAVPLLAGAFWANWWEVDAETHIPSATEPPDPAGALPVQVIASAASTNISEVVLVMRLALAGAKKRIRVCTPYFVLDDLFKDLLSASIRRGVAIEIMIPGDHMDSRFDQLAGEADFQFLLALGVDIYRYQKAMLHAKLVLIDEHLSIIGSCNLNQRSLYKDDEVLLNVWNTDFQAQLWEQYDEDLHDCEQITHAEWRHRSIWRRALEKTTRPFRQQL